MLAIGIGGVVFAVLQVSSSLHGVVEVVCMHMQAGMPAYTLTLA